MRIGGFPSKMGIQHHIDNDGVDVKIFQYPRHIGTSPMLAGGFLWKSNKYQRQIRWDKSHIGRGVFIKSYMYIS